MATERSPGLEERRVAALERIASSLYRLTGGGSQSSESADQDPGKVVLGSLGSIIGVLDELVRIVGTSADSTRHYNWYQRFTALETAVTPGALETMQAALDHHVTEPYSNEQFRSLGPKDYENWLKRLLYIQRVYEYILFTDHIGNWASVFHDNVPGSDEYWAHLKELHQWDFAIVRWLHELVYDRDFRMAHLRQGAYYPEFAAKVNAVLKMEADVLKKKMEKRRAEAETVIRGASPSEAAKEKARSEILKADEEKELANEMESAASSISAEAEYDRYRREPYSPETLRQEAFIREKGGDPDMKDHFLYAWVRYPGLVNPGEEN